MDEREFRAMKGLLALPFLVIEAIGVFIGIVGTPIAFIWYSVEAGVKLGMSCFIPAIIAHIINMRINKIQKP